MAIPILSLFLISFLKFLKGKWDYHLLIIPIFLFSVLILLHHLSAACAIIFMSVFTLVHSFTKNGAIKSILGSVFIILGSLPLCSFWLFPFLSSLDFFIENPFFNRNVLFPFVGYTFFSQNLALSVFGILIFSLAIIAMELIFTDIFSNRKGWSYLPVIFLTTILIGMIVYDYENKFLSRIMIVSSFCLIFGAFILTCIMDILRKRKFLSNQDAGVLSCTLSFIIFLWLSMGYYAIPPISASLFQLIWKSLDVERFWLFLALPMSILGGRALATVETRRFFSLKKHKKKASNFLVIILIFGIVLSGFLKAGSSYIPNQEIPKELIEYFKSETIEGRILPIECPLWIYVLPRYVNKTLIDGWYPQQKLLPIIARINDYRLNELECHTEQERIEIWRNLIYKSELLGINWIMIGTSDEIFSKNLTRNTSFIKDTIISTKDYSVTIFKSETLNNLVEIYPHDAGWVKLNRIAPDRMILELELSRKNATVLIKESYFHTWMAISKGNKLEVMKSPDGYIQLYVSNGIQEIEIFHTTTNLGTYYLLSMITFGIYTFSLFTSLIRKRVQK